MGDLKPIGSEKLQGQEKINRIIEISRYKENIPNRVNENSNSEYSITFADGNKFEIVREKQGYIIKKRIDESTLDYIEPMKNRKYHSSYSQALKKLNLMIKENNSVVGNEQEISLFEQKTVLKLPKQKALPAPEPEAAPAPAPAPSPEPEAPSADLATPIDDVDVDAEVDIDVAEPVDEPAVDDNDEGEEGSYKQIQKLTGKLTQKMRSFNENEGLDAEQSKYVLNMVISAINLDILTDEDKEEITAKFEPEEEGSETEDMSIDLGAEIGGDDEISIGDEIEEPIGFGHTEVDEKYHKINKLSKARDAVNSLGEFFEEETSNHVKDIVDSIFSESKVERVLSKYFEVSDGEKRLSEEKKISKKVISESEKRKRFSKIKTMCESVEQELAAEKFLSENLKSTFLGKTNKNNLVFKSNNKQVRISPEGLVI
jgi:hypothetical protein